MPTVTSSDGTAIGYETTGSGPALLLVDGAFCYRGFGPMPGLAGRLAEHFTVYTYDRRGRGESGDTQPYAAEREIDDIEAVIDAAGGRVLLFGTSSGAVLALRAAATLPGKVERVAVYEPPMTVDDSRKNLPPADYRKTLDRLIADGRNGEAVAFFMTKMIGAPALMTWVMRLTPPWRKLKAVAPTLRYDFTILGDTQLAKGVPAELTKTLGAVAAPALVASGGKSPTYMQHAADAVAGALSDTRRVTIPGQTHMFKPEALAPELTAFYTGA
jgi:pimeloyl-ACP methyl ester carboxylesterase